MKTKEELYSQLYKRAKKNAHNDRLGKEAAISFLAWLASVIFIELKWGMPLWALIISFVCFALIIVTLNMFGRSITRVPEKEIKKSFAKLLEEKDGEYDNCIDATQTSIDVLQATLEEMTHEQELLWEIREKEGI